MLYVSLWATYIVACIDPLPLLVAAPSSLLPPCLSAVGGSARRITPFLVASFLKVTYVHSSKSYEKYVAFSFKNESSTGGVRVWSFQHSRILVHARNQAYSSATAAAAAAQQ